MSRTVRDWVYSVPVHTTDGGMSNVVCNQLKTVDKGRLTSYKGKLTDAEMKQVDEAIRIVIDLPVGVVSEVVEKNATANVDLDVHALKVELEVYKKLFDRLMGRIIDTRFGQDVVVPTVKHEVESGLTPLIVPKEEIEPINVDVEELKKSMGAIPKKEGRGARKKHGLNIKSKPEEFIPYKTGNTANVNTDDWWVIVANTGINIQTAQQIVAYRNKHGKYKDLSELLNVTRWGTGNARTYNHVLEV